MGATKVEIWFLSKIVVYLYLNYAQIFYSLWIGLISLYGFLNP